MRAMKDSGIEWIGEIPQEWVTSKIKYCASLDQEKLSEATDPDYSFQYIDIGSVTEYGGIGNTTETTFAKSPSRARMVVHHGDTIISTVRTYLKAVAYIDHLQDHICSTGFCVLTPSENMYPKFGYYLLQSDYVVQKIVSESVGVSYPAISSAEIGSIKIALPKLDEQIRLTEYLDAKCAEIDALIAAKEKTNALLKERRQSIIYEAVTKGLDPTVPMKDSGVEWIGEIPEGWQVAPLKYFASIRSGFTLGKKYDSELELREYPYLRVANVQGEYTNLENVTTIQMPAAEAEQYKLKAGELLMTEGGDRDKLGRGSIWHGEIPDCLHQNHVFALSTDERMSIEYLDYLTASDVGRNYFDYTAVKTTNLASTNATTILNFKIPIPSIEEQRDIVACLKQKCTDIDRIIQKNNDTIQKLNEYRQSLIYEAVTGKIEI